MRRGAAGALLACALTAFGARAIAAEGGAGDLQSPEQRSTRHSAYTLPAKLWSFDVGALGVGGGDVVAVLGVSYGLGAGVQLSANLAHYSVGLFNLTAAYQFVDTRYFALGARFGAWYGHGKWYWVATPIEEKLVSKLDVVSLPLELTASSMPTRWLELDLSAAYSYARFFGSSPPERSVFTETEIGLLQFFVRPGARLYLADHTALELFTKLPLYSAVPLDDRTLKVPFKRTWTLEGGLRSRLARGLFGSIRLHYGSISDVLYGARFYPSFEVELRR